MTDKLRKVFANANNVHGEYHFHMFYVDADNKPCAVLEGDGGLIHLCYTDEMHFLDKPGGFNMDGPVGRMLRMK